MASRTTRKTWETAFLLSASMSSSYQETFDRASEIMRELGADNVQLGDEAERAAQRQENAFQLAAAAIAETGLTELLGQVKDAYADIITVTEEFEYTMSAVEAIASASADDVAKLEAKARELGETTVYTAQQSAEAMTFMAQAGWDTTEMLEGMSGVISLAAASGTDLAETSSIVADTLAGFGMAANETGRLADVLAQVSARSNTNVSMLGQTFSNVAATAGALGFSIEDVSVMLGTMANAGIKGAKAGTQLRMILNGLSEDITLTGEAFGEANISLFDENGDAIGLMETARLLRGYFDQMTTAEKIENAQAIAGKRNFNGLLAIVNATDEQFEELYDDIENAGGAAKRMADTRLDNLKGDVTLLNSAFESLKITVGEHFMPAGREFTQWMTSVVTGANELIEAHPGIVTGINMIAGAVGGVVTSLAAGAAIIKAISSAKLVMGLFGTGAVAPTVAALGALAGILAAIAVRASAANQAIRDVYAEDFQMAESLKAYAEAYTESAKEWRESVNILDEEAGNTEYLIAKLDGLYSAQDKTLEQKQQILSIVELLNEAVPELALAYDAEADSLNLTADAIRERARAEIEAEAMAEKQEQLKERIKQENGLEQQLAEASALYESTKAAYESVYAERLEYLGKWWRQGENAEANIDSDKYVKAAQEAMDEARAGLISVNAAVKDNRWWIDELSRDLSGDTRESGQSSGGGGTAQEHAEFVVQNYAKMQAELKQLLNAQNGLEANVVTAQKNLADAEARYRAGKEKIDEYNSSGILKPTYGTTEGADIWDEVRLEYVQALKDFEAAQTALQENESNVAELSSSITGYEEAHGALLSTPTGYTVTVENNINITGSADEDTVAQIEEITEEVVERALKNTIGARTRLAYDGG